jgi:hypothetical protein
VNNIISEDAERRYAAQAHALQWVGEHWEELADAHEVSISSNTDGTSTVRVIHHVQDPKVPLAPERLLRAKALTTRYRLHRSEVVPGGVTYRGRVLRADGKSLALHVVITE